MSSLKRHLPLIGRILGVSVALALAFVFLYPRIAPGSAYVVPFNSDHAIPVLMANDEWRGLFSAFYYGQDRLGGWPMGVMRVIRDATGIVWTPEGVFVVLISAFSLGLVALVALHRLAGAVIAAGTLLALMMNPVARAQLADIGQPYGYQVACLAGCWWALRRTINAEGRNARVRTGIGFFVLASLTVWLSTASIPLLLLMLIVEALRPESTGAKARFRATWPALLGLAGSVVVEAILRGQYHRHARDLYGHQYRTSIRLDTGHLIENVQTMGALFWRGSSWLVVVLGVVGAVAGLWVLWRRPLKLEKTARELYLAALVLVSGAMANLAVTMVVGHVRLNDYSDRYLAVTHVWWITGAVCAGVAMAIVAIRRAQLVAPISAGVVFAATLWFAPPPNQTPVLEKLRAISAELFAEPGPQVIVGNYWHTYLFAGLAPPGELIAIPKEGHYLRTPFDRPRLAEVEWVWFSDEPEYATAPRPFRPERGQLFKLESPELITRAEYVFARYRRIPSEQQLLKDVDLCAAEGLIRVPLGAPSPREVFLQTTEQTPLLEPAGPVVKVEALPGLLRMELREGASGTLEIATGPSARILGEPGDSVVQAAAVGNGTTPSALPPCPISAAWLVRE